MAISYSTRSFRVIGLMSGTSLDGLDIAGCVFTESEEGWQYEITQASCPAYDTTWLKNLQNAPMLSGRALLKLHRLYGYYIAEQVNDFIVKTDFRPDFISSHGHTIFHEPTAGLSFQLGEGAAISADTRLPVVCDFRSLDICAGGQGAPLVPIGDKLLFGEYDYCLNLGGIANISFEINRRVAFDISPCNLILNQLARKAGLEYDSGGHLAASGKVDVQLMDRLNAWPYYRQTHPKSLDKESLQNEWMPMIEKSGLDLKDLLATVTEHIACQVGRTMDRSGKVLVTGGGAFNHFLIDRIRSFARPEVIVPDEKLVSYKEALVFAFLGLLRVLNKVNCLASVTGAAYDNIGGTIWGDFSAAI